LTPTDTGAWAMIVAEHTARVDADAQRLRNELQAVADIRAAFRDRNLNLRIERRACIRRMIADFRYLMS